MQRCPHCLKEINNFTDDGKSLIEMWEGALGMAYGVIWCHNCSRPAFHIRMEPDTSGKVEEVKSDHESVLIPG